MWMIWGMLIVAVPLLGLAAYETWRNNQIDKYEEEQKQKAAQGVATAV